MSTDVGGVFMSSAALCIVRVALAGGTSGERESSVAKSAVQSNGSILVTRKDLLIFKKFQ